MGFHYSNISSHSKLPFLLLSLLLCSTHTRSFSEGRQISRREQADQKETEKVVTTRAMIGSRPPRCERRCAACGHCEAVQVPAVPQEKQRAGQLVTAINSRGDDTSNYKPVSWKCKCGDIIMNP